MDGIQVDHQRNLAALQPLTIDTCRMLRIYIFQGHPLQGGCQHYQSLAERAVDLRDLQQKLHDGRLDLGTKDKAWAIAKCIGAALLTVAVFAAAIWIFKLLLTRPHIDGFISGAPIVFPFMPVLLFVGEIQNAQKVFARPSPQQLSEQLTQVATQEVEGKEQVQQVIDRLTAKIASLDDSIQQAGDIGNDTLQPGLTGKKEHLARALADLQRLKNAVEQIEVA